MDFNVIVEKQCFDDIYSAADEYISDNYYELDIVDRLRDLNDVVAAEVESMDIKKIRDIEFDGEILTFSVDVCCDVVAKDVGYGEEIEENIFQWLTISCSSRFEGEISDFEVEEIRPYVKAAN